MSYTDADNDETPEFYPGQELTWEHGDNLRIAKVVEVGHHNVVLSGMTCEYRMSKAALRRKIDSAQCRSPITGAMGAYSN